MLRRISRGRYAGTDKSRAEDAAFRAFVAAKINTAAYLNAYPDVRASGIDPVDHWLEFGLREGRILAPGVVVQRGMSVAQPLREGVHVFTWRGETVVISGSLPSPLSRQIMAQARHEPAVLAPGMLAVPHLRWYEAGDLLTRDNVNAEAILRSVHERPGIVMIISRLRADWPEKYGMDLIDALMAAGGGPGLAIVTDETANEASGWPELLALAAIRDLSVMYWRDVSVGVGHGEPRILANFLNALRPAAAVVINSRLGFDLVARYGRALSRGTFLCCTYFRADVDEHEGPIDARLPRLTLPRALALTDNEQMASNLRRRYGGIEGPGIAVLPCRVQPVPEELFAERLEARLRRITSPSRRYLWACVCSGDDLDQTTILGTLANLRPDDRFEVIGSAGSASKIFSLGLNNVFRGGVVKDIAHTDFSAHDGCIMTGPSERIATAALEMSKHAMPLILADVDGPRDTFDDFAVIFVQHAETAAATSARFATALLHVTNLSAEQTSALTMAAVSQMTARHAPANHARVAAQLFGLA